MRFMENRIKIEFLSEKTLYEAGKLTVSVFHCNRSDEDYPPKWFKASLSPEENKKSYSEFDVKNLKYWVALMDKKVVGVIGYYTLEYDEKDAYWLGWYCVDPEFRGGGIGKRLLEFIIKKTKEDGRTWLRLYTSNEQNEKRANQIYDKLGFKSIADENINKIITSKKFRDFTKGLVYRELKVN